MSRRRFDRLTLTDKEIKREEVKDRGIEMYRKRDKEAERVRVEEMKRNRRREKAKKVKR